MTQLIEEKFKTLSYEELLMMLQLTPFEETRTFKKTYQRKLQEYSTDKLIKLIKRKYHFAESTMSKLSVRLRQLTLPDLEALFEEIFDLATLRELNEWINARLPAAQTSVLEESPTPMAKQLEHG